MLLIPAIDLKDGKCVRLLQGRFDEATVYGDDPALMARRWEGLGAEWIHLVDLDASRGRGENFRAVSAIRESVKASLQLGGGIKDLEKAERWFSRGVDRLVMGTAILENLRLVEKVCARHPGRIAAALDTADGKLKTWGWTREGVGGLEETAKVLRETGISLAIHTDILRDGTRNGPNIALAREVALLSGLPTIVSGGISGLEDLRRIKDEAPELHGAIAGKALYAGDLDFARGKELLSGPNP
ncbi:MAG: 1-(5-phosphoribosyl)-5-((5-phosphoribosylamino)methylideneamino)imidazole-4-carboxamide isomerase [Deltaproteobacteria bacterium]|jgi:phosphoribosylformimino-5-aminoimidazole carboxamide ribotide isomerase|nr:1-(5-phosphoribosyl)-5-((5-phosphoribosylamino)methylideneamino)imidazole-4-carboxamide isomerase [Deltaproteobacteria bacterium]